MKNLAVIFFLLTFSFVQAQRDSLLRVLKTAKEDENKVLLLIKIGQEFENSDLEKSKFYYLKARSLGKKINYPLTELKFISNYTFALNMQGKLDSSLYWNLKGIEEAKKLNDINQLAKAYFNTGTSYNYMSDYQLAITFYQKGLEQLEKTKDTFFMAQANDILQTLYTSMKQYDKAKKHSEYAISQFRKLKDFKMLAYSLTNLGVTYGKMNQKDTSFIYHKEAYEIAKNINDEVLQTTIELNLADVYLWKKQIETSKEYYETALQKARKNSLTNSESIALTGLSFCYMHLGDYKKSLLLAEESYYISSKNKLIQEEIFALRQLASLAYIDKNISQANYYETKFKKLQDSLLNKEIINSTIHVEKKFEFDKKNSKIKLQEEKIKQKNLLSTLLIGGILSLLLIIFLGIKNYIHKQKLQQAKIDELETDKQLSATEAILKGEEQERTRLAKDLHDGLGGMLSGIKHSFQNIKENLILTPENAQSFSRSIDMLDSSIQEMRRVAHNMMPEILLKYGLNVALKEFCDEIDRSSSVKITYQSMGMDNINVEQTTAVTIYRVVQELINNALKYANAQNILIQLHAFEQEKMMYITVEDDGKGFDINQITNSNGIGWNNIQNRIDFLKGKIDLESIPNKGTSVHIEIPRL